MSNVRVKGYNDITFWQDSGVGVIVLRSNEQGLVNWNAINELVASIGTASIDDNVNAIAITGINENFCTGLKSESSDLETVRAVLDSANSLISLIYSLEKPVFSILPGNAIDAGYELALIADVIISHQSTRVGFTEGYTFALGGSITSTKFRNTLEVSTAKEGFNLDRILNKDTLLEDSMDFIMKHRGYDYHLIRRRAMKGLRESMLEERENFFRRIIPKGDDTDGK